MEKQGTILSGLSILLLGTLIGWQAHSIQFANSETVNGSPQTSESQGLDLGLFWDVKASIEKSYVDLEKIDNQKQLYGAISGLVNSLDDPYSVFMDPEETKNFNSSLNGELEGIGAELTVDESGSLSILAPLKDSPAQKAGLLPGDIVYKVDDQATSEMTLWEAIMEIRGEQGTDVHLTILRDGVDDPIEMIITRQEISVPSVELETVEKDGKNIAHLSIYQFGDDTYSEFEEAVRELTLNAPDGLVLDLRMNGGGYLDAAVKIASEFFSDERTAVIVKYRDRPNEVIKTTGNGQLTTVPIVVLIDSGSASASEILAGALQDHERATLMGVQSFGKGSVQELKELRDSSTLRMTVAKWYTPFDNTIDHTGVTPDIEVKADESESTDSDNDVQLNAAVDYLLGL